METVKKRRRVIVDDSELAAAIGGRIKRARLAAGLTQAALAGDRYTKAYISALEHGIAKPSMAALNYLAPRLGSTASALIADSDPVWDRISVDLRLASGDWLSALDGYETILADTADRGTRAEILSAMAECLTRLDRPREAIRPATEAAELFNALDRREDAAMAEYWLASGQFQSDNIEEARAILDSLRLRVIDGLRVTPDFRLRLLISSAMIDAAAGLPTSALATLEEARGLAVDLDDRRRGAFLGSLANAHREAGDLEAAISYGLQAVGLLRAAEADRELGHLENQLALSYLANGNGERAADMAHRARVAAVARHDEHMAAHLADTEAMVALESGDAEAAEALADEALILADLSENSRARLEALMTRAKARALLGRHDEASADLEHAAELATAANSPVRRREVLSAWADSLAALGQHDRAFAVAREALDQR
ncbi:MAG TPA: helix-turn-helix domain-containing protein [Candidatus Saccharimonadales bacterium]|nr:helix-turn-helix domain-containing protein [Candidatus Saccharimonadales bacterium]